MKKKIALLMAVLLFVTLFAACQNTPKEAVVLSVNVGPEPETIDPAMNSAVDGATLIIHGFEGLMKLDKDGVPVAGMADSYTVSDDKLTYTFTLKKDAKWSDGTPVTAGDFAFSWNRAADPATASPYGYIFDVIAGYYEVDATGARVKDAEGNDVISAKLAVTAVDDSTLEVKLAAPCPYFLELCAFPTYSPVKQDLVSDTAWATAPETYIGNGPYKLVSWTHSSEMIYEKNKEYYDYKNLGPDQIKFVLMDDDNAILAAFQNGEISFADSMPNDEIDAWRDKPEFNLAGQLGTYYLCFNCEKAPFDNVNVRKALSLAIDRDFIVTQIGKAGQVPAAAFVPIGMSGKDTTVEFRDEGTVYFDPTKAGNEANLAEAKRLLAEAGYPDGKGFPKFEYMYNTGTGHQQIAEALQNMWKTNLGVECTLVSQEWGVFTATRRNGDYSVARNGWLADYNDPITFLDMFQSNSGNNDSNYNSQAFDAQIATIKSTDDRAVRYDAMHAAEDILMADAPLAPVYYYVDIFLKSPNLEGFYASPLGYKYFMYSSIAAE